MADPRLIADFNDPALAAENKRRYRSFDHQNLHAPFYAALRTVLTAAHADGKETRVLDVGSGTGENASLIADLGASVVAVEPAGEMRKLGLDLYARPNIQLVDDSLPSLSRVRAMATGEKRFDAVLVSATLQYVPPDDLKDALVTIATISKPAQSSESRTPHRLPEGTSLLFPWSNSGRLSKKPTRHYLPRCICGSPPKTVSLPPMAARHSRADR